MAVKLVRKQYILHQFVQSQIYYGMMDTEQILGRTKLNEYQITDTAHSVFSAISPLSGMLLTTHFDSHIRVITAVVFV